MTMHLLSRFIFTWARILLFFSGGGGIYYITPESTVWKAGSGFDWKSGDNEQLIKMRGDYVLICKAISHLSL